MQTQLIELSGSAAQEFEGGYDVELMGNGLDALDGEKVYLYGADGEYLGFSVLKSVSKGISKATNVVSKTAGSVAKAAIQPTAVVVKAVAKPLAAVAKTTGNVVAKGATQSVKATSAAARAATNNPMARAVTHAALNVASKVPVVGNVTVSSLRSSNELLQKARGATSKAAPITAPAVKKPATIFSKKPVGKSTTAPTPKVFSKKAPAPSHAKAPALDKKPRIANGRIINQPASAAAPAALVESPAAIIAPDTNVPVTAKNKALVYGGIGAAALVTLGVLYSMSKGNGGKK